MSFTYPFADGYNVVVTRGGLTHGYYAVDFAPSANKDADIPILATRNGTVVASFFDDASNYVSSCSVPGREGAGYGWLVIIEYDNGHSGYYAHLESQPDVSVGDTVVQGQQLGLMGNTGCSTGKHLHYELRKVRSNGQTVSNTYIPDWDGFANAINTSNDPVIIGTKNFHDMNNDGKDDITFQRNSDGRTVSRNGGMYRGPHDSIFHGNFDTNLESNGILDLDNDGNMDLSMRDYRSGSNKFRISVSLQNGTNSGALLDQTDRKVYNWEYLTTLHNENGPDKIIYSAKNGTDTKLFADTYDPNASQSFTGQHLGNTRNSEYIGKADINGDGREDILTRYSNGHIVVRYDGREATREPLELVGTAFEFAGAGNFDTRTASDEIAMLNPNTRELRIYNSYMTSYSHRFLDERVAEIVGVGNMDGQGGDDLVAIYDDVNLMAFKNGGTQIHNLTDLPSSGWNVL